MKRNRIFAWMAVAMTLAACSTNDIADITANDADNIVNIASVTRSGEGGTATSTMTAPFHLVNVTQQTNYGWKCEADYTFTYDSNSSTGQYARKNGDLVVWCNIKSDNSSERMVANEFQAFSPLRTVANEASYTTFQILPDQSTAEKLAAADWMTATTTLTKLNADNQENSLDLNFEHKNAKLHFDVTLKGDVAASVLSSETFKVLGTITPYYNSTDNSKTIEAIVKPKDYSESGTNLIELSINIDENTSETLAVPFPSGLSTLSPGKQYNFNLVIGHNAATISSVSVTDWDNSSIDLGGHDDALTIPYVTFTSNEEVGFKMESFNNYTISGLEYSVNNGEWTPIPSNGISDGVPFGGTKGKLRLRGKNKNGTAEFSTRYATISFTSENSEAKVACTGDIRTLLDYSNYNNVNTRNARFMHLFMDCKILTLAPELPATTLADYCYYGMFKGCKSLTKAPQLPATTLAYVCYLGMFDGCTSLTTAPVLPAKTLVKDCYLYMFDGCTKLKSVTMLATGGFDQYNLRNWLNGAGTEASSRTLTVANQAAYNAIKNNLPDIWQSGEGKATVIYKDGNTQ